MSWVPRPRSGRLVRPQERRARPPRRLMDGPPVKSAAQLALERELTPSVFLRSSETAAVNGGGAGVLPVSDSLGSSGSRSRAVSELFDPQRRRSDPRTSARDPAVHHPERQLPGLHARNRHQFRAPGHDHLRHRLRYFRRRRQGGAARARQQARRRDARPGRARHEPALYPMDRSAHAHGRRGAARFARNR